MFSETKSQILTRAVSQLTMEIAKLPFFTPTSNKE